MRASRARTRLEESEERSRRVTEAHEAKDKETDVRLARSKSMAGARVAWRKMAASVYRAQAIAELQGQSRKPCVHEHATELNAEGVCCVARCASR